MTRRSNKSNVSTVLLSVPALALVACDGGGYGGDGETTAAMQPPESVSGYQAEQRDQDAQGARARAILEPASGSDVRGQVNFVEKNGALQIAASVRGLDPGRHGLHLHENGDCSAPDASSAGGHFAPDGDPHGAPQDPPGQHHVGDLGNLQANDAGKGRQITTDGELTLQGENGVVGRAVIVHAGADDMTSQPSGDAGKRIACGVVTMLVESAARQM